MINYDWIHWMHYLQRVIAYWCERFELDREKLKFKEKLIHLDFNYFLHWITSFLILNSFTLSSYFSLSFSIISLSLTFSQFFPLQLKVLINFLEGRVLKHFARRMRLKINFLWFQAIWFKSFSTTSIRKLEKYQWH